MLNKHLIDHILFRFYLSVGSCFIGLTPTLGKMIVPELAQEMELSPTSFRNLADKEDISLTVAQSTAADVCRLDAQEEERALLEGVCPRPLTHPTRKVCQESSDTLQADLGAAVEHNDLNSVHTLINMGATDCKGKALGRAAQANNFPIVQLLVEKAHALDVEGRALRRAVAHHNAEMAHYLILKANSHILSKDYDLLSTAAMDQDWETVNYVIQHTEVPDPKNNAISYNAWHRTWHDVLDRAAWFNSWPTIGLILEKAKAPAFYTFALEAAITARHQSAIQDAKVRDIVKHLINEGAQDPEGQALAEAARYKDWEMIDLLINKANARDPYGRALGVAAMNDDMEMVVYFIRKIKAQDPKGQALEEAVEHKNWEIIELLVNEANAYDPYGRALTKAIANGVFVKAILTRKPITKLRLLIEPCMRSQTVLFQTLFYTSAAFALASIWHFYVTLGTEVYQMGGRAVNALRSLSF